MLNGQPLVSSVSVNLTTETAIVWPVSEAKTAPNWQKQLGKTLAEHLSSRGFNSNLRGIFLRSYTQCLFSLYFGEENFSVWVVVFFYGQGLL